MMRINDLIGMPFKDDGRDPVTGIDCLGISLYVARRLFGRTVDDPWDEAVKTFFNTDDDLNALPSTWRRIPFTELQPADALLIKYSYGDHLSVFGEDGYLLSASRGRLSHLLLLSRYRSKVHSCWRLGA